jgi:hypothetical protein
MNTKKILLVSGGAVVLGAVAYFVWSFFQKVEIPPVGTTSLSLGIDPEDDKEENNADVAPSTTPFKNPFTDMLNNTFEPITKPKLLTDISNFPLN